MFAFLSVIEPRLIKIQTGRDVSGMSISPPVKFFFCFFFSFFPNATFFRGVTPSPSSIFLRERGGRRRWGCCKRSYRRPIQRCALSSCNNERNNMIVPARLLVALDLWLVRRELLCAAALILLLLLASILHPRLSLSLTDDHNAGRPLSKCFLML